MLVFSKNVLLANVFIEMKRLIWKFHSKNQRKNYLQTPYAETEPSAIIAKNVPTNIGAVSSRYVPKNSHFNEYEKSLNKNRLDYKQKDWRCKLTRGWTLKRYSPSVCCFVHKTLHSQFAQIQFSCMSCTIIFILTKEM